MTLFWHQLIQRDSGLNINRTYQSGRVQVRGACPHRSLGLFSGTHVVSSSVLGQEMANGFWNLSGLEAPWCIGENLSYTSPMGMAPTGPSKGHVQLQEFCGLREAPPPYASFSVFPD